MKKQKKNRFRFHTVLYAFLRPIVRLWLGRKMHLIRRSQPELPAQFLLISNHVTNFDPFLVISLLKRTMYFVATEHIFSLGWLTKLIVFFADPIPRPKAGQAAGTVLEIKRRLKAGASVGLFAEGNCSWDGRTQAFSASTGKLVRAAGVPLVTCRIRGGYLSAPRWADYSRKGPVFVEVMNIRQPEELKAMSAEEIDRAIADDIYEDAYLTRDELNAVYPGKKLAEGIENALFVCPRCHAFGQFESSGDSFSCRCGLKGTVDRSGNVTADGIPFTTMKDWEDFQQQYLRDLPAEEFPAVSDPDMKLSRIEGHERRVIAEGTLTFSPEGLSLGSFSVPVCEMTDLAVRLKGTVTFSVRSGEYYEIKPQKGKQSYHGRKYYLLFHHLKQKELYHDNRQ